jgi:hypothetical protein
MFGEEIIPKDRDVAAGVEGAPTAVKQAGSTLRAFKQGNLPLVVLFAAGLACVYILSLRHGPAKASAQQQADEIRVESALAQLRGLSGESKTKPRTAAALVNTFHYETKQRQIPMDQMKGNPFECKFMRAEPVQLGAAAAESDKSPADTARYEEAMAAVKQLRLQSILVGSQGATAMISGNLLTEGQVIRGWTVSKIQPRSVTLTWKDETYELKMP